MKKNKRYRSEREILALIHACHRDAQAAIIEAESFEALAKDYFKIPDMVETAIFKKSEAVKARQRANRLLDSKAKKLGECLAEFQSVPMPFLTDSTVKGV